EKAHSRAACQREFQNVLTHSSRWHHTINLETTMKLPKKFGLSLAALTFAASFAAPAYAQLKIGHMGSMSGTLGALGADQYDGFMLRVAQNDGKLGGQAVEVLRADDQSKPEVGLQLAREFIEKNNVDIVVGITASNVINAVFPYIVGKQVPFI